MTHRTLPVARKLTVSAVILGFLCSFTAVAMAADSGSSEVKAVGEYVKEQKTPDVDVVLGYRYATMSVGDPWLLLELALTSPPGHTADMKRENIFVITPDGTKVPAAGEKEFLDAYPKLRDQIARANIARDPMGYFPPDRQPCALQLFRGTGEGIAFDSVSVDSYRACEGKLFFHVPGGTQPGRYVLGIDFKEAKIRIPFDLEASAQQ